LLPEIQAGAYLEMDTEHLTHLEHYNGYQNNLKAAVTKVVPAGGRALRPLPCLR
jgi:hypothetical protein